MNGLGRTTSSLTTIGAAILVLLVLPSLAGSVGATPTPNPGGAPVQWAYGGQRWVNVSVTLPNASYQSHAFFGWQVVFTATNTSNTTVELEAQRTMAASFDAQYCSPNCANASTYGNLSVKGWERDAGFANLTTAATVTEAHNTSVAALGLVNASSQSAGALNESMRFRLALGAASHAVSASLHVAGRAHASVAFAPALGLVPWNVSTGDRWSSTSQFTAQGSWLLSWQAQRVGVSGGAQYYNGSAPGSINASGSVTLTGTDLGNVTLANGQTVPAIALLLIGPFDDADGVILVPHGFNLFASAHADWQGHAMAVESVATAKVDLAMDSLHRHVRVAAAATDYAGQDSTLATMSSGATLAVSPSGSASPTGPTEVQAQPESVAQAQQASSCLVGGCHPSSSVAPGGTLTAILVVGLVVAAVVGAFGTIEYRAWARRKGGWTAQVAFRDVSSATPTVPPGATMAPPPPPAAPILGRPPSPP
jgi:hypothetical protein